MGLFAPGRVTCQAGSAAPVLRVCEREPGTHRAGLWARAWARGLEWPERLLGVILVKQSLGWSPRKKQVSEV